MTLDLIHCYNSYTITGNYIIGIIGGHIALYFQINVTPTRLFHVTSFRQIGLVSKIVELYRGVL